MHCNHCGQENPLRSNFCSGCGEKIPRNITDAEIEQGGALKTFEHLSPTKKFKMSLVGAAVLLLAAGLSFFLIDFAKGKSDSPLVDSQSTSNAQGANDPASNSATGSQDSADSQGYAMTDETFDETYGDPGSYVWQQNLDMTGTGTWVERGPNEWKQNVEQQYLFVNQVGCLFYVFDENTSDADVMNRAYQWLVQYSGVHIAGSNWILMDSSYGEKCTGPVTDTFGGYRLN